MTKQNDVFDYIEWRGDLSFEQSPFNEVDALILSIFSYLDFSCLNRDSLFFRYAIECINSMPDKQKFDGPGIIMKDVVLLANAAAESKRYETMRVFKFADITNEDLPVC